MGKEGVELSWVSPADFRYRIGCFLTSGATAQPHFTLNKGRLRSTSDTRIARRKRMCQIILDHSAGRRTLDHRPKSLQ